MAETIEGRAVRGSVAGALNFATTFGVTILQVPILLTFWDAGTYGSWAAIAAFVATATAIDWGYQAYLGNVFNREWIVNKSAMLGHVGAGIRVASAVAVAELVLCGICVAAQRIPAVRHYLTVDRQIISAAVVYFLFWLATGATAGIFVKLYVPIGLYARSQWLGAIYRIGGFLALVLAAASGVSLVGAMAAQVTIWSAVNVYVFVDLGRRIPGFYSVARFGTWRSGWLNFKDSLAISINSFIDQFATSGQIMMLTSYTAPAAVATFITVRTTANMALQASSILLNPLQPDFVRLRIREEGGKLAMLFDVCWFLGTTLTAMVVCTSTLVIAPAYELWTRRALPFDPQLFCYLAVVALIRQWIAPLYSYLFALNIVGPQTSMAVLRAVFGLGVTALLMPAYGTLAAGMGTLVGELAAAVVCYRAVGAEMRLLRLTMPRAIRFLAIAQSLIAIAMVAIFAVSLAYAQLALIPAVLIICALAWLQWRNFPVEMKSRLRGMLGGRASADAPASMPAK